MIFCWFRIEEERRSTSIGKAANPVESMLLGGVARSVWSVRTMLREKSSHYFGLSLYLHAVCVAMLAMHPILFVMSSFAHPSRED